MSVAVFTSFNAQVDSSGNPLSGGSVTIEVAGTTTLINNYTASDLSGSPASNPITLDSAGRHDMRYIALQAYKIIVKNSSGSTIYTRDNIDPGVTIGTGVLAIANGGTGAASAGAALTALGGATAASVAAIAAEQAALSGTLASSEKTHIATGTTGQRPAAPIDGDIRKNTTTARYEFVNAALAYENVVTTTTLLVDTRAVLPATTFQYLTSGSSATYTAPTNPAPRTLRIKMTGAGGGGAAATANNGSAGGTSTFNSIDAAGGSGGQNGASGSAGGAGGTGGAGSATKRFTGSDGACGPFNGGGSGGAGPFGGSGKGGTFSPSAGTSAKANTGAGGGGAGAVSANGGGGGGQGEYVEIVIASPSATYTYTIGTGGAGGSAGTTAGAAGGSGMIIVEEYY